MEFEIKLCDSSFSLRVSENKEDNYCLRDYLTCFLLWATEFSLEVLAVRNVSMQVSLNLFMMQISLPEKLRIFLFRYCFLQIIASVGIFCDNSSSMLAALFCFGTIYVLDFPWLL